MNTKAKGSRAERRAMRLLEAEDYRCCRSGASLGLFDVIGIRHTGARCIQVKSGNAYASSLERELLRQFKTPRNITKEIWRFPDRCKAPLIEVVP